ncbi:MAG TPA: porin family protein [Hanamia sp.]|nr:porin family protein [Hanamia sp.]
MYKKFSLLILSMIIYSLTFAQINYGFKAGVTESFLHDDGQGNYDFRTGFQIGVFAESPLTNSLNIRSLLQLTQKGFRAVEGNPEGRFYWNRNFYTSYLELPINLVYNFDLNRKANVFIGSGPVFSLFLFGKAKTIIRSTDQTQQTHTEYWVNTNGPDKKFDMGWEFLIGFKYSRAIISANYNHGLLNILNSESHIAKNRSFAFTLGYFLKK